MWTITVGRVIGHVQLILVVEPPTRIYRPHELCCTRVVLLPDMEVSGLSDAPRWGVRACVQLMRLVGGGRGSALVQNDTCS